MKAETKKNSPNDVAEDANIDKIRDILFGSQSRDFERRFIKLEDRINKEINEMRDENRRKLDALEEFIKNEVKSLTERLVNEQNTRVDADKEIFSELKDLSHNLDKKITGINEQTAKSESEIRQQILNQSKNLTDEIHKRHNDIKILLENQSNEIRDDKADKSALAELFAEMSMRLSNDFKLPKIDD